MAEQETAKRQIPDPPLAERGLIKALSHPLRQKMLFLWVTPPEWWKPDEEGEEFEPFPQSPTGFAKELDEPLGNTSYHIDVLKEHDCVELVKTEPRRGAVEHFYVPTPTARMRLAALASIGPELGASQNGGRSK